MREWALWGVRNITEGNDAAQKRIQSLEVKTTVDSPELEAMGMRIEMDPRTGKPRMVKRDGQPADVQPANGSGK